MAPVIQARRMTAPGMLTFKFRVSLSSITAKMEAQTGSLEKVRAAAGAVAFCKAIPSRYVAKTVVTTPFQRIVATPWGSTKYPMLGIVP